MFRRKFLPSSRWK